MLGTKIGFLTYYLEWENTFAQKQARFNNRISKKGGAIKRLVVLSIFEIGFLKKTLLCKCKPSNFNLWLKEKSNFKLIRVMT